LSDEDYDNLSLDAFKALKPPEQSVAIWYELRGGRWRLAGHERTCPARRLWTWGTISAVFSAALAWIVATLKRG
jgi:hypothetical protein